jgi:hypothetical protein
MKNSIRLVVALLFFAAVTSLSSLAQASFSTAGQGGFWGPGLCENMHGWSNSISTSTTIVASSNEVRVRQFILQSYFTIGHVTIVLGSGSFSGTTFNFGIYSASGSLLLDSGPFSGVYTEDSLVQTLSITSVTLAPGTYYFAQTASESDIQPFGVSGGSSNILVADAIANATTPRFAIAANAASGGALPSTLGTLTAEINLAGSGAPLFEP